MNREEAIERLNGLRERCERMSRSVTKTGYDEWIKDIEGIDIAISALRGPTREQVEKVWRGEWSWCSGDKYRCKACNQKTHVDECMDEPMYDFCPYCGSPMTDKAVDIIMERLEALYD